jgi:outer membrane protein
MNPWMSLIAGTALLAAAMPASAATIVERGAVPQAAAESPADTCPSVSPRAITLASMLARSLCLDPGIQRARAARQRLDHAVREARSPAAWQVEIQAGPTASLQTESGRDTGTLTGSANVALSKLLRDGGATDARAAQAASELLAAEADLRTARQDALRASVEAWADVREAQGGVFAATRALDAARQSRSVADARVAVGLATRTEALSAASAVAQAERDVLTATTTELAAIGVLAERLGWAANTQLALAGDAESVVDALTRLIGHDDPMALLADHPRLVAQRERVAGRGAARDAARAEEGASLAFNARTGPRLNRSNALTAGGGTGIGSYQNTRTWNHEVSMTWTMPLSDGGARSSRVAQAQSALDGARAEAADLERSLRTTVWQQWTAWRSAGAGLNAARSALSAAEAAEAGQRARYQAGVGTLSEWLTAQADLASRVRQIASAEQTILRSAAGAAHALGRLDALALP